MKKVGTLNRIYSIPRNLVKGTGNLINDLAIGLSTIIGGVTNGLEIVTSKVGDVLQSFGGNLGIDSSKVFKRVGDLGVDISKKLGNIVEVVPILGNPVAYVVKGAGSGIYYVVTTVGNLTGQGITEVGKLGKKASNVVVFTVASASDATEGAIKEAGKKLKSVTDMVNTKKSSSKKKSSKK